MRRPCSERVEWRVHRVEALDAYPAGRDWERAEWTDLQVAAGKVLSAGPGSEPAELLAACPVGTGCRPLEDDLRLAEDSGAFHFLADECPEADLYQAVFRPMVDDKADGVRVVADANPPEEAGEDAVAGNREDGSPDENRDSSPPTNRDCRSKDCHRNRLLHRPSSCASRSSPNRSLGC